MISRVVNLGGFGMLCQNCNQREALIHLALGSPQQRDFCRECADNYYATTPGMNSSRALICLDNWYRSKLYDLLEKAHPEAFDNSDAEACRRATNLKCNFLKEHLTKDKIELNQDGFEMLCMDFCFSHHFYRRADEFKRKRPNDPR
jgi:hypothetical protein